MSKKAKKAEAKAALFENMSMLIYGGSTVQRAVTGIYAETAGKKESKVSKITHKIAAELLPLLDEGYSLSHAIDSTTAYFTQAEAMQIRAGEKAGNIDETLMRLSTQLRDSLKTTGSIKSALIYPIVIFVLVMCVAIYLFIFVMPDVFAMLADVGVDDLPAITKMVMGFGNFVAKNAVVIFTALIGGIVGTVIMAKKIFPIQANKLKTKIPLIGKIWVHQDMAQFYNAMRYCLAAGIPILESLESASRTIKNKYMQQLAMSACEIYSNKACQIDVALREITQITSLEMMNIQTGFSTGRIFDVMAKLEDNRRTEMKRAVDRFTAAFNPIMIVFVGFIVGIIVMSVYTPLLSITQMINK